MLRLQPYSKPQRVTSDDEDCEFEWSILDYLEFCKLFLASDVYYKPGFFDSDDEWGCLAFVPRSSVRILNLLMRGVGSSMFLILMLRCRP